MAGVESILGVDLGSQPRAALDADLVHVGIGVAQCADPDYALVGLHEGTSLDRTVQPPRLVAENATMFAMVAGELPGPATDGWAAFPVAALIHPGFTRWGETRRIVVQVDELSEDELVGRIAAIVDQSYLDADILPAIHAVIADRLEQLGPCTSQQCDPVVRTLLDLLDDDDDGEISLREMRESSLVMTALRADVDGAGPSWDPRPDGEDDSLSIGVAFHASRVRLVQR